MWYTMNIKEIEKKFRTNIEKGLSESEVKKRKEQYGENKLDEKKKESLIKRFFKQFNDFMIIILLVAAVISSVITKLEGSNDYIDSIIIISIVILNSIMGVIQEAKAEKSLEALKQMSAPVSKVRRNGRNVIVRSSELVPGDIIILEAGNYIPADCRLIESRNLKVEESSLTGETVPVLKDATMILNQDTALGDMINMAFATTISVNGYAEAIVTETGMNTKVGK